MSTEPVVVVKRKRAWWKYAVGALFGCGAIVVAIMASGGPSATPGAPSKPASGLTMTNFNRVTTGMDCAGLPGIFGGPGTLTAETGEGEFLTQSFDWQRVGLADNAVVTVMCQGGKVDTKAQAGLR